MEKDPDPAPLELQPSDDDKKESVESESLAVEPPEKDPGKAKPRPQPRRRARVEDAFWSALWPALEECGWTMDEGRGKEEGLNFFKTPDELEEYDRIEDVVDRVLARKSPGESRAADAYELHLRTARAAEAGSPPAEQGAEAAPAEAGSPKPVRLAPKAAVLPISRGSKRKEPGTPARSAPNDDESKTPPPKGAGTGTADEERHKRSPNLLDVSWKDGGKSFPQRSSSVGPRYQATKIPDAGTYDETKPESDRRCTLIWDPAKAEEKGVPFEALAELPSNTKETAVFKLAELDYDMAALQANLKSIRPSDGSNWGQERRDRFRDEVFRSRKDFKAVCKAMRISMKTCLAYYYGTFKSSDDYRLLKTVCAEEDAMRLEAHEHEFDACAVCGDGGNLLICDGCEGEYHMECCRPPLRTVPDGQWLCDECVDRRFLAARQHVIKTSRLFEKHPDSSSWSARRDSEGALDLPYGLEKVLYKPSDEVMSSVRKFASELNQVLTGKTIVVDEAKEDADVPVAMEVVSDSEATEVAADEDKADGGSPAAMDVS